jgi:ribosomal-protein-alanine N-acetyltransferase
MSLEDIPQVLEVDRESYTLPWPASAYRREIMHNRNARYFVLREDTSDPRGDRQEGDSRHRLNLGFFRWTQRTTPEESARRGRIVGYAGMWLMIDEAHVTTIAVRNEVRGRGLGELLLLTLLEAAAEMGIHHVTLEVRVSNETAQNLYRKYGFKQEGLRTRYYSDNNEDAYIMTTPNIQEPAYRATIADLTSRLQERLERQQVDVEAAALLVTRAPGGAD